MIIGYILVGIATGLVGAVASLILGASLWSALGVYTLSGMTGTIVISVVHAARSGLSARRAAQRDADHHVASSVQKVVQRTGPLPTPNATFTILTVDDDPFILDLVNTIGTSAGAIDIVVAPSAAEALELLASTDRTFDYLLFDITMPEMSGIELCRTVRQMPRYGDVPIVMLTALRDMIHISDAYRAGATDYATKPFDIEALRRRFMAAHEIFKMEAIADASVATGTADTTGRRRAASHVDHSALSGYLTLLSENDAAAIQVLGIKIDRIETLRARYTPARLADLLDTVAATAADTLEAHGTIMAFNTNDDLLVATPTTDQLDLRHLEARLAQCIHDFDPDAQRGMQAITDAWWAVSVGHPVRLQGTKAERAKWAMTLALNAADNRALSKARFAMTGPQRTADA